MSDLCTFDSTLTTFDSTARTWDQTTCQAVVAEEPRGGTSKRKRRVRYYSDLVPVEPEVITATEVIPEVPEVVEQIQEEAKTALRDMLARKRRKRLMALALMSALADE